MQFGSECEVVTVIQNRSQRIESSVNSISIPAGAISAFMQKAIWGWVYLEVKSVQDIDRILVGLADICMQDGWVEKHLVHISELDDTRRMLTSRKPTSICCGSFVQVKGQGLYGGMLGLVKKEDTESSWMYVVVASWEKAWTSSDKTAMAKDDNFCSL